jgi:DNA-binding NarL/FixJ family response regulator
MPNLGIIILSLLEPETYRPAMLALGADEFVHKEELSDRLIEVIHSVYQKHKPSLKS